VKERNRQRLTVFGVRVRRKSHDYECTIWQGGSGDSYVYVSRDAHPDDPDLRWYVDVHIGDADAADRSELTPERYCVQIVGYGATLDDAIAACERARRAVHKRMVLP
jgi:hypothetical protein